MANGSFPEVQFLRLLQTSAVIHGGQEGAQSGHLCGRESSRLAPIACVRGTLHSIGERLSLSRPVRLTEDRLVIKAAGKAYSSSLR